MIIPSFTGFAQTPNTAQAYLGGIASSQKDRQIDLEQQQMAQQAANAQAAIQFKQQELQVQQQQDAMRAEIAREQLEKKTMIDQQQINIDQQYKEQMAGIQSLKLDAAQKTLQIKIADAAQKHRAQQEYGDFIKGGGSADEGIRRWGPSMGVPSGAYNSLLNQDQGGPGVPGSLVPLPNDQGKVFWQNRRNAQYIAPPSELGQDRLKMSRENNTNRIIEGEIKRLSQEQADAKVPEMAYDLSQKRGKVPQALQEKHDAYLKRAERIEELKAQLPGLGEGEARQERAPEKVDSADEVVKLYKGKRAVFNKRTKKFIRYE